jgi:CHAT domain-containing protein/tetratricopeptide (TPR) repeat protein
MRIAAVTRVLAILCCAACATSRHETPDALVEAQRAFEEGRGLKAAGQYAQAMRPIERALKLRETALGELHPAVASCLSLLGDVHQLQGHYTQAEPLFQRALAIRQAALSQNHPDVAASLNELASLYTSQGLYARAQPLHERALEIREEALGRNHPDVAESLHNLAILYMTLGLGERAGPLLQRALEIREEALGDNHPDVATSLNVLGVLYRRQALYSRAEPLLQRALAIREKVFGPNHRDVANSLHNLADLYSSQGHHARAELYYERSLAIREAVLGPTHLAVAYSLHGLADLYLFQGSYTRAEPLLHRALAIQKSALGPAHPSIAISLRVLASIYEAQGLHAQAESLLREALAIQESALGQDHPDIADSLHILANLYSIQGLYARAEPLLLRALAIREARLGKDHPYVADSLNSLADIYLAQGHPARTAPLLERALAIQEKAVGQNDARVADTVRRLASHYFFQGRYAQAAPLHERALAIREAVFGEHHPDVILSLQGLALTRLAQHRLADALTLFERALASSETQLRQELFTFSDASLSSILQLLRADEERLYALTRRHPGDARVRRLALSAALLRKGRAAGELAATSRIIYRSLGQEDHSTFERLRTLRTQFATASLAGPGPLSAAEHQQRLKDLVHQSDVLEARLAERSAPLRALSAQPPVAEIVDRVAAVLPRNGALVEFIAYDDSPLIPKPGSPPSQLQKERRYMALLLFADGRSYAHDLGPAEPIDRAALRMHDMLSRQAVSYRRAAQELHALVFRPLMPHLAKVQRLLLSPDGQLALIPFAALHDGRNFLLDVLDITYLTSGKDLLRHLNEAPAANSVVVLADPDFDSAPAVHAVEPAPVLVERSIALERFFSSRLVELPDVSWPSLPGTRQEAEAIQRLFPHATLLLGRAATKDALLKLPTPGILHIATHGFFLKDAAAPANIRGLGGPAAPGGFPPAQHVPDPLLRSGLVLAGADAPASQSQAPPREHSLVTALELAGMDLWGSQLVVLSACDTGRGDIKLGQGVHGLRRALVVAGAETLVTSLWQINDGTTHELMESYYRNLMTGQGRAAALRQAMRELRRKYSHPHFWAPFIAIGKDAPLQGLPPLGGQQAP